MKGCLRDPNEYTPYLEACSSYSVLRRKSSLRDRGTNPQAQDQSLGLHLWLSHVFLGRDFVLGARTAPFTRKREARINRLETGSRVGTKVLDYSVVHLDKVELQASQYF